LSRTREIICYIDNLSEFSLISPLLRYFGVRIISHFPCNFKCKESLKIAKKWLGVMYDLDADATEWLKHLLSKIQRWDSLNGVVEVHTPYFIGITHTYPYIDKKRVIIIR